MNAEEPTDEALTEPGSKRVLIVDDDATSLITLRAALQTQGFHVDWAANGGDALHKVAERVPDLIITDLMMPGIGGYEFVKELQGGAAREIPIIVASAREIDPSTESMIRDEANVVEFMRKPLKMHQLYSMAHGVLKTRPGVRQAIKDHWGSAI